MDYDSTDIPLVYDRGRDHGPEVQQLWMNVVASYVGKQRLNTILDLGCGTGRFSESVAAHFDAEVVGIDPSVRQVFESAGFSMVSVDVIIQKIAPDHATYAEKLSAGADSVLAQLAPTDFKAGIEAMRAYASGAGGKPVSEPIDIFVFR